MDLTIIGLIIIAFLELILIAILYNKIINVDKHSVKADIELFKLIVEISQVMNDFNKRIETFEQENEK